MEDLIQDTNLAPVQVIGPEGAPVVSRLHTNKVMIVNLPANSIFMFVADVDFRYVVEAPGGFAIANNNSVPWGQLIPRTIKTGGNARTLYAQAINNEGWLAVEEQE
jgi:hypothetical protein